jgi:hypothetical protein
LDLSATRKARCACKFGQLGQRALNARRSLGADCPRCVHTGGLKFATRAPQPDCLKRPWDFRPNMFHIDLRFSDPTNVRKSPESFHGPLRRAGTHMYICSRRHPAMGQPSMRAHKWNDGPEIETLQSQPMHNLKTQPNRKSTEPCSAQFWEISFGNTMCMTTPCYSLSGLSNI